MTEHVPFLRLLSLFGIFITPKLDLLGLYPDHISFTCIMVKFIFLCNIGEFLNIIV